MDELRTKSTSFASAECSDVVLKQTSTTRLVFRPMIVDNRSNPDAAVKGIFIHQRKSQKDEWSDTASIPLSTLKKDEGYKLEIKSAGLLSLFKHISQLYEVHAQSGVPQGDGRFVRANENLAELAEMPAADLRQILAADRVVGSNLLARLLAWATESDDPSELVQRLVELSPASLQTLNVAVNLQRLKSALDIWEQNSSSSDEEFWQQTLTDNSFVLEHVFSWPATIVKGKAYVGGKSFLNSGGNLVDFLLKNRVTRNAALIEIKTPATKLLGREYRLGVFAPSQDLAGSVMQVLNYKHSLQRDHLAINEGNHGLFDAFDPRCAVILGTAHGELDADDKRKSFELFRAQFQGVAIITFDELFSRTRQLVQTLESPSAASQGGDVPF